MDRKTVRELIIQLRDIILEEREYAKQLNIQAMLQIQEDKSALIKTLSQIDSLHPDDRKYAEEIHWENRRNAFLFKSTLNWIRDTMEFFGSQLASTTYGKSGATHDFSVGGRLLSGRI